MRMSQVMLKSPRGETIEPLIISALEAQKNEILTAIMKTKQKLSFFEKKFNLFTSDFVRMSHAEMLQISEMDAIEWLGEHETLKRLQDKLSRLQEIKVCT
jgi:hypothetical protein